MQGVAKLHNNFSVLQEGAYDALLKATGSSPFLSPPSPLIFRTETNEEGDKKLKQPSRPRTIPRREELKEKTATPPPNPKREQQRAEPPRAVRSADQGLADFIARTKRDLEAKR